MATIFEVQGTLSSVDKSNRPVDFVTGDVFSLAEVPLSEEEVRLLVARGVLVPRPEATQTKPVAATKASTSKE